MFPWKQLWPFRCASAQHSHVPPEAVRQAPASRQAVAAERLAAGAQQLALAVAELGALAGAAPALHPPATPEQPLAALGAVVRALESW